MKEARIAGLGLVSPLGRDVRSTLEALRTGRCGLGPLTLFAPAGHDPLPVGQVPVAFEGLEAPLARTHALARRAADQAMAGQDAPPDAVVVGTTTGGMALSEELFKEGVTDPGAFVCHRLSSVAEDLARRYDCRGPVLTVSTACSSGAVAIRLALEMIRRGLARRVLAGGADSLCRLTYYGFRSLQLLDPAGARPLDAARRGMSLAEAAAMVLLDAQCDPAAAAVLGGGLSCDAFHPTRPHPQGRGALAAMSAALADAGLSPEAIDYVNLHGTGTPENDLAEARALRRLFGVMPVLSSIKGATGHSLAASGAVEAAVAALCIGHGLVPGSVGLRRPDPALGLIPQAEALRAPVAKVLSNSFGFGGNNASLVIGRADIAAHFSGSAPGPLRIVGLAAVTGAGPTRASLDRLRSRIPCQGCLEDAVLTDGLAGASIRRLRRLARMALALAEAARPVGSGPPPDGIFFGTAMGALSETHAFLDRLFISGERFGSPTDFVGSVHNAPAGQVAMHLGATGPNIALSGGDASFAQALLAAELFTAKGATALVLGADEFHEALSPCLDPDPAAHLAGADGGGALWLQRRCAGPDPVVRLLCLAHPSDRKDPFPFLAHGIRGKGRYDLILTAGGSEAPAPESLAHRLGHGGPVWDLVPLAGRLAAPAVAVVLAADLVRGGRIPDRTLGPVQRVLVVGAGPNPWAIEVVVE